MGLAGRLGEGCMMELWAGILLGQLGRELGRTCIFCLALRVQVSVVQVECKQLESICSFSGVFFHDV